jgi:hypothetical protein
MQRNKNRIFILLCAFVWNAVFSFDYKAAGDVAEALRRTVCAATYVIKKPLDAEDLCRLWRIIQWSKVLLRRGENTLPWLEWPRRNQALPATIEALLPSSSTFEDQGEEEEDDDDGCDLFKVVRAHYRSRPLCRWLAAVGKEQKAIGEGFADGKVTRPSAKPRRQRIHRQSEVCRRPCVRPSALPMATPVIGKGATSADAPSG